MNSACLCILILSLQFVCVQLIEPCIFHIHPHTGFSLVHLTIIHFVKPLPTSTIKISFTIANDSLPETVSPGSLFGFSDQDKYEGFYRWSFRNSLTQRSPKVTEVTLNEDIICSSPGDKPTPTQNVTEFTFEATWEGNHELGGKNYEKTFERIIKQYQPERTPPLNVVNSPPMRQSIKTTTQRSIRTTPADLELLTKTHSPVSRIPNNPITTDECGVVAGGNERVPLINKGKFYERGELPWLVAVYRTVDNNLLFICGGTLVSDRHVVTAAHCLRRGVISVPMSDIVVKVGVHSLNDWSDKFTEIRKLIAATIHKEYNPDTLQNDILILTLNTRVQFNRYIRPACLWSGDTELSRVVRATGVVAGWGARAIGDVENLDQPQMVRVPIVSTTECRASKSVFHSLTYDNTLCAGDRNGEGPCTGDSGGGLYVLDSGKWRLRGVVSVSVQGGDRGCDLNEYVVYTDTAQFLPWIRNVLSEKYYD